MKGVLVEALKATLVGDNNKLRDANTMLSQLGQNTGYCLALMELIDDPSLEVPIKQAALIQLKNNIKGKWKPKNEGIMLDAEEKKNIRDSLIRAVARCAQLPILLKLYREIVCIVIGFEYEVWAPLQEIQEKLRRNQDVIAVFHCIIGICSNFEFCIIEKEKVFYTQFLATILPVVLNTVKNNLNSLEVIYLALKILYKAVHYEVPTEIKILTNPWMELLLLTITAENEAMHKKVDEFQHKGTQEFFYFHSKKWATRILMRYVQKHAKELIFGQPNTDNLEFARMWHQKYGPTFIESIVRQLSVPTIKKVRYFQLKVVQGWIQDKPEMMLSYAKNFQYDLLLHYMAVTPEDERLAQDDVLQYLRNEDEPTINFSNLKKAATDVWLAFFHLGNRTDREHNIYYPGPMFAENFSFLLAKIQSQNLIEKELAMYIFCQIRVTINRVPEAKNQMQAILDSFVIPQFNNHAMLLRARANDMFAEYGKSIQNFQIIEKATTGIYKCMSEDPSALVKIKAAIAFHPILALPQTKQLVKPMLKNILEIYLKLIELFDCQPIVAAMECIIRDFSGEIDPFAVDLFKYLSGLFVKMFNKDSERSENEEYGGEIQLAASGCLKTMSQIVEAELSPNVRKEIEEPVLELCAFIFSNQSVDYAEDIMYLLNAYLYRMDKLSPNVWFFYQVVIYFLVGIPQELWKQIQSLNMPQVHKSILLSIRTGKNIDYLEHSVPVLRNYISKGMSMIVNQKEEFKKNFLQMFFYLISSIFKGYNPQIDSELELDCGTMLLIYLMESFPPELTKSVASAVWSFVKFNFHRGKSTYLKLLNLQLIFVLFWKHPIDILNLSSVQEKYLPVFGNFFRENIPKLQEAHERKRVILGICQMLTIQNITQELHSLLPFLFETVIKLMSKNCRARIILSYEIQERKEEVMKLQDEEDDDDMPDSDYDDEDFWDENYHEKFQSILAETEQIIYFRQKMDLLQKVNPTLYSHLLANIQNEKLNQLKDRMDTALKIVNK